MVPILIFCLVLLGAAAVFFFLWRQAVSMEKAQSAQIQVLQTELNTAHSDRRDLFFSRVLGGGHFETEQALHTQGKTVGVEFPYQKYVVLVAKLETWGTLFTEGSMNIRDLYFVLRNVLENSFPGKTYAAEVHGNIVAILNLEALPKLELRGIVQDARRALEVLEAEFGLTVTVAISRVYESPLDLRYAMQDTVRIFEYQQLIDEDCPITTYEELTHFHIDKSTTSYLDLETRLLGCARAADFAGMRVVLHELIQGEFSDTRPTIDTFRFRLYGVVNTLLYLINDIQSVVGDQVIAEIDPGPRLTSAETLTEIITVMDDILDKLEQHTSQSQQPTAPAWVHQILGFVEENYRDPNLTVSYIADQFHVTLTYCSKMFRKQFGVRLFDFIQKQRLDAAMALMETDMNLKDIAEKTGFSSALTMSRAFKRYHGVAPNKIREQLQKQ